MNAALPAMVAGGRARKKGREISDAGHRKAGGQMSKWVSADDPRPAHVREFVDRVRAARAKVGHELALMQEAIATEIARHDPNHVASSHQRLKGASQAIEEKGEWVEWEEWRISTTFETRIVKTERNGKTWYEAAVECDGQRLACGCPTLKGAFAFVHLYKAFIVDQFYSVGPPWADTGVYGR
jgi:hypothetical protein